MALHDFMPYGAPDLLADQERRMARASATASALLVGAFAALVLLLPRVPIAADAPAEFPGEVHEFLVPPSLDPPAAPLPQVNPTPAAPPTDAVPVPVPDDVAPTAEPDPAPVSGGGDTGEGPLAPPAVGDGGGVAPDGGGSLPPWETFVSVDELPALVSSPAVAYPDFARDAGIEGRVLVRMLVGRDGRVKDAVVDPKHSVPALDEAALAAARASVFTPATSNGHPVAVWVARPYEFRLR